MEVLLVNMDCGCNRRMSSFMKLEEALYYGMEDGATMTLA